MPKPINDLTLPGSIPGLLRRGSPVHGDNNMRGIVLCVSPTIDVGWADTDPEDGSWCVEDDYGTESLALDLTDATGRTHAAWWLAERTRPEITEPMTASVTYGHPYIGAPGYGLAVTCRNDGDFWRRVDAPELEGIDPHDPRLLEDGSRWVDAEALRLVCLHVAGAGQ